MIAIHNYMKRFTVLYALLLLLGTPVLAADYTVAPLLIDDTVEPRGIITRQITLTNTTNKKLNLYASVNEISIDDTGGFKEFVTPVMTDRTNTVTSWIEISRGRIELFPGETTQIPVTFRIHPNPEPGEYHAFVGFGSASKRYIAQKQVIDGDAPGVVVKLTIEDQSEEFIRISGFLINRFITNESQRVFNVEVQNLGDVPEIPQGEVIFYNSTGEEIGSVPINEKSETIQPGETGVLQAKVPFFNELGRYKANISLEYGKNQNANVYDSTQFYMMPLLLLMIIFAGIFLVVSVVGILLWRSLHEEEDDIDGTELPFYVRDGHDPNPKHHDIDLSKKTE